MSKVYKQACINGTWYHICPDGSSRIVYKYTGHAAEATPEYAEANGVMNGEWFVATDTEDMFQWDEPTKTWVNKGITN